MNTHPISVISILSRDRQNHSSGINRILTENGHLIIARFGINLQKRCLKKCPAIITIIAEGNREEIKKLEEQLATIGVEVKINIFKE